MDYDPFDDAVLDDPFPSYARLLEDCPVHRADTRLGPLWTATRHADVVRVARDHERFTAEHGQGPLPRRRGGMFADPPEHTPFRRIVQGSLGARRIEALEPMVRDVCSDLLDALDGSDRFELHDTVACPLPVIVIARMLGVAEDDLWTFKHWSDETVAGMNDPSRGVDERRAMDDYLRRAVEDRWASDDPPDDLITRLCTATVDGRRLGLDELLVVLHQLLVGGNETTTSLMTNLVWRLLEDRTPWERIVSDPSSIPNAIEESLRHDPPVLGLYRQAVGPQPLGDETLPDGARVMMCFAAANRDPDHFDRPDEFVVDRDEAELKDHLAFGTGIHFCPGAALSRLETRILLEELVARFPDLELDDLPTERIETFVLWGRHRLHLRRKTNDAAPGGAAS